MYKRQNGETGAHLQDIDAAVAFTGPDKMNVIQFVPPPAIAPYVSQIYIFRCDEAEIRDVQPAALGHLVFILRGTGTLQFNDGHCDTVHMASVFGPATTSAEFAFAGPLYDFGLALTPLGFVALTGKPASDYADRIVNAEELFGSEIGTLAVKFRDGLNDGSMRTAEMVDMICAFLLQRVHKVPAPHIEMLQIIGCWLSSSLDPSVETLFAQLPVSRSTATRLINRYFGSSAKMLMRKYRAVRAATILCDPNCTAEMRAEVEGLFYDQPHLIREIRHFTGRTPGALDSDDTKILRIWLSKDNYRDLNVYPG